MRAFASPERLVVPSEAKAPSKRQRCAAIPAALALVTGGREINFSAFGPREADQCENALVIREQTVVDVARIGEIRFQLGLAAQQGNNY